MEPLGISAQALYWQNLESLGYIFVTDGMGLSSFKFSRWGPKDTCFETVHNGPSRSSKVVDFGTHRKRVYDFLLVINSNFGPILPGFKDITILQASC